MKRRPHRRRPVCRRPVTIDGAPAIAYWYAVRLAAVAMEFLHAVGAMGPRDDVAFMGRFAVDVLGLAIAVILCVETRWQVRR